MTNRSPSPMPPPGDGDDYGYLLGGVIEDGIQIGFCSSTGGGWGESLVAHQSQLHPVPDHFSDEAAVMLEPAAGGVHAALKAQVEPGASVAVLGAGTMGLCSLAALRSHTSAGTIIATAKHPHQRDLATALGADIVVDPPGGSPRRPQILRLSDAGRLPVRRSGRHGRRRGKSGIGGRCHRHHPP